MPAITGSGVSTFMSATSACVVIATVSLSEPVPPSSAVAFAVFDTDAAAGVDAATR